MAIRRRPRSVEDFITQGGKEPQASLGEASTDVGKTGSGRQVQNVRLRIDADLLEQIDQAVGGRRSGMSRHTWILEAIVEKLVRESG